MFDVKTCRSTVAAHYQRTATVPTSVWSKTSPVDIHQIYTRLSWVKQRQTLAGSSQSQLNHYTNVFSNKNGVVPKRILVQGQTGIGKSTFVKKLAVDWAELNEEKTGDREKAALKKFELILVINLKEVSKCPSLRDVISRCNIFPDEETALVEDLLCYITKNQEKVLLVFDGYDEYHCGSNSDIYEIFRRKKLRDCCVLVTTRISKADELREFTDVHAEITGFSKKDRQAFMRRMLGDQTEASRLNGHLSREKLTDLTRVPLLLLFFCTLWKKGKLKSFPETKAKLYLAIVQYVLDYSQGKNASPRFRKVQDFEEILTEIGKVALECLLKDDHVFEYDQLPLTILCDASVIIGLLQVTEYAENLRPAGMVSFIHKSIQEFLAAWYITHRCVPEGNLGGIGEHARTLEDCQALENVFRFVCGLSDGGAANVFQHLTSVRVSDSELDLLQIIPSEENEADVLCDGTLRQRTFSKFVFELFQEVDSKAEVLSNCFDCLSGVILVPADNRSLSKLLPNMKDFTELVHSVAFVFPQALTSVFDSLEFLGCLHAPLKISASSKLYNVGDFLIQFMRIQHHGCGFTCVLRFRNGQFQFHIRNLTLHCDDHARLFTETNVIVVPSLCVNVCSEEPCLKYLRHIQCYRLRSQTMKALGALMRDCNHLKRIEVQESDDSVCDLLEQVPNPSKCSLMISSYSVRTNSWLQRFNNIITLDLDLSYSSEAVVDTLVTCVTHKTLERLVLSGISLTSAAATALGRSLPEMSSLEILELAGKNGKNGILTTEEMEALFGGFYKPLLPLYKLSFRRFIVTSSLASLTKSFRFFPNLRELNVGRLSMDERNTCVLLESLRFIPHLERLSFSRPPGHVDSTKTVAMFTCMNCNGIMLEGMTMTPAVAAALGQSLPKMSSLQLLRLTGVYKTVVQAEQMQALFGRFNAVLPLQWLTFSNFSVSGCLAPLTKSLRFFPNLKTLSLGEFNMDDLSGVLDNLKFIPNLEKLSVQGTPLGHSGCCTAEVNTTGSFTHTNLKKLKLNGIILTPAVAAALGRLLPEMSSLKTLVLTGVDESIVQAEEMQALFSGFNKLLPLYKLTFSGFSVRGCLAALTKSFGFFPKLGRLNLENLTVDEHDQCSLLESFGIIGKHLRKLSMQCKPLGHADCRTAEVNTVGTWMHNYSSLEELELKGITLTPAVVSALGRSLLGMLSLLELELTGVDGSILETEDMEALFGGFNKTLPLCSLTCRGFSVSCCLAPLTNSLRFFPDLTMLILEEFSLGEHDLCCLLENLRYIPELVLLNVQGTPLRKEGCCSAEVNTVSSFTHMNLRELTLNGMSLTLAVAVALGRLLPEMPSLETLVLTGVDGNTSQAENIEALFDGFNKALPLCKLTFSDFKAGGCLASLAKSLHFFPDLTELNLENLNMDENDQCSLLENFGFTAKDVTELKIKCRPLGHSDCRTADMNTLATSGSIRYSKFMREELELNGISLTSAVATVLGQLLPEMSSLRRLELTGVDGSIVQAEEMEALFGGFNKTLPLYRLTFSGFSVKGGLAPLTKSLHFFPHLIILDIEKLNMAEQDMRSLLDSLIFIPNRLSVHLSGNPLSGAVRFTIDRSQRFRTTVKLSIADSSEEDLSYVQGAFKQAVPQVKFYYTYL